MGGQGSRLSRVAAPSRPALRNAALALGSACVTYLACEAVVSRVLLDRVPLNRQEFLAREVRLLAQTSKQGILPRPGYILMEGDSYALGAGDWLRSAPAGANPPFHSAHVLHQLTGRDVLSFARSGTGSLRGYVIEPRQRAACLAPLFDLPAPGLVLAYFYEGNDLDDNLVEAVRPEPPDRCSRLDGFVLAHAAKHRLGMWLRGPEAEDTRVENPAPNADRGDPTPNVVRLQGVRHALPLHLQGPALGLSAAELEEALAFFERSLDASRELYPDVPRLVVYLPSPLASYPLLSRQVDAQKYREGDAREYPSALVTERSDFIAARVRAACARLGVAFLDARPALRTVAERELIHGPLDFKHYNERGYSELATVIAAVLPPS